MKRPLSLDNKHQVKDDVTNIKSELGGVRDDLTEIKTQLDAVCEQTAILTEFKTDTAQQFAEIKETLSFVLHKEYETGTGSIY